MDYLNLMGRPLEEVLEHLGQNSSTYRVSYTTDPRKPGDDTMEQRVIRIRENNAILQILVGYFQKPCCKPMDAKGAP